MCVLEFEDQPDVWSELTRTARKAHRCTTCGVTITPGARYLVHFSKIDGEVYAQKACDACRVAREMFSEAHEGLIPTPSWFEQVLINCINEGDEDSDRLWSPMLDALRARRGAAA